MVLSLKLKIRAAAAVLAVGGFLLAVGCVTANNSPTSTGPEGTNAIQNAAPLLPGPNDARIANVTAQFFEEVHYLQEPLDKTISGRFFDQYLDMLDPNHENFLQSDIDEFSKYRTTLGDYMLGARGRADLTPAYVIFERFEQRLRQHGEYVDELLQQDHFDFNTNERYAADRHQAPWPKSLADAQNLWREETTYQFMQERIGQEVSSTNAAVIMPLPKGADREIADKMLHHNEWALHQMTNLDSGNILQIYLEALAHAYDPHSDYLNYDNAQNFSITMGLSLVGIGAELGEEEGYCTVDHLIPGGPAARSGQIHAGDRIIAVGQSNEPPVNVVDMELPKVVDMIRGQKGDASAADLDDG